MQQNINVNMPPFQSHMTFEEANKLKINDKIDHRDEVGRFVYATVKEKQGTRLKIHYDGWSRKWDTLTDYSLEIYRFAIAGSISKRAAHKFRQLKKGDYIDINPTHRHPGWKCGEIRRLDQKSGQIQVVYESLGKHYIYWAHVDNVLEIAEFTSKSGLNHSPPMDNMRKNDLHQDNNIRQQQPNNMMVRAKRLPRYPNEKIGSGLQEFQEEKDTREEMNNFLKEIEQLNWKLIEVDADGNCLYKCFAINIYNDITKHMLVRKECCEYMRNNKQFFQNFIENFDLRIKEKEKEYEYGDHIDIIALSELYNVRIRVFEYDKDERKLYMSCDQGEHEETVHLPLILLALHRKTHYNIINDPQAMHKRPLNTATYRKQQSTDKNYISLRELRLKKDAKVCEGEKNNTNIEGESVRLWLENKVKLAQYYENFINEGFDSMITIIETLNENDLLNMGLNKKGHRNKIMLFVNDMRNKNNNCDEGVDGNDCIICWERNANMFNDPCGHVTYCDQCSVIALKQSAICPHCRVEIECKRIYNAGFVNDDNNEYKK